MKEATNNLTQLRLAAREIFDEALRAVDSGDAVRGSVAIEGSVLRIADQTIRLRAQQTIYSIAIGKAALAMARALDMTLNGRLTGGVIATNASSVAASGNSAQVLTSTSRWKVFQGGHPEPNEQSLAAAQASFDLLTWADEERALVIFLISGGGSAMIEWPLAEDITLADLRVANKALVNCGASISEINAVRRAFSTIKGGRLADRAPNCDQITLIISDVPPGDERNVASGPTLMPASDAPAATNVIERYGLRSKLPVSILRAIDSSSPRLTDRAPNIFREHFVLLDNNSAIEAATKAALGRGFITELSPDISDQPIQEGCEQLLSRLARIRDYQANDVRVGSHKPFCLISGGEFACPVMGDGTGGRNLETAMRLALLTTADETNHFVALCAGTDGIDGNSPAAGAIVDTSTIARARAIGIDAEDFLNRSDAYSFFVALGDVIATGPTGTNVRDLRILLAAK
jgi:glycerate 2-kinase